ncbi:MAG: elongation factor P maturation arginine rhamnosyltransferase EarP [Gallionella sp.]
MKKSINRCDIFCNVIDNYGDIGVCWRLARQLANEHGLAVRLWVDDLGSLAKLCHEADAALDAQRCRGVEIRHWHGGDSPFALRYEACPEISTEVNGEALGAQNGLRYLSPNGSEEAIQPADLVIEAFSCKLPQGYLEAMAEQESKPVWINLEYLSAEDWVHGCHGLPSPHPSLPLTKYFFFPGFTKQTGGLLLERDLFARRDAFQGDAAQQNGFWQSLGMETPSAETLKISLFGYENDVLAGLFDAWANGAQPVLCLVPEGRILPQVRQYFGDAAPRASSDYARDNLEVRVLPFVEQERYDELLWACDINFVRGEDSCVRAQWAARPFVWHIYPQRDGVHMQKLRAFMARYCAGLPQEAAQALRGLWEAWNGEASPIPIEKAWNDFHAYRSMLRQRAQGWARELAENNLALNLLDFSRKIGRMRAFEIEGQ